MAADPSLGMCFPGLKMRNYAASATCLWHTLFADTRVLAFIAPQWTMFDDRKSKQYLHLVWNRTKRL